MLLAALFPMQTNSNSAVGVTVLQSQWDHIACITLGMNRLRLQRTDSCRVSTYNIMMHTRGRGEYQRAIDSY